MMMTKTTATTDDDDYDDVKDMVVVVFVVAVVHCTAIAVSIMFSFCFAFGSLKTYSFLKIDLFHSLSQRNLHKISFSSRFTQFFDLKLTMQESS